MRKGIIVALACLAAGFSGLFASPAKGLQFGFNAGYTSVGFQLHGVGGEFLFGFQGQDEHRPKGSVLRIGLASAAGTGETDLNKATWNGAGFSQYIQNLAYAGIETQTSATYPNFARLNDAQQQQVIQGAIQQRGATAIALTDAQVKAVLAGGYGITDLSEAKGKATAFFVSATYEYVLPRGAPGLGFIVGGELYVSEGSFSSSNPAFPSVSTEGGIGGGGVVGVSYYLKNGFNITLKTGLGVIDPGKVVYNFNFPGIDPVTVEPKEKFYASPTFALGFIY